MHNLVINRFQGDTPPPFRLKFNAFFFYLFFRPRFILEHFVNAVESEQTEFNKFDGIIGVDEPPPVYLGDQPKIPKISGRIRVIYFTKMINIVNDSKHSLKGWISTMKFFYFGINQK